MVELLEFTCGQCEAVNRLKFERILALTESPKCGRCKNPLLRRFNDPLHGLLPSNYTHSLDTEALAALHKVPGINTFFKWMIKQSIEKQMRLFHHANYLKVDETQVPGLYKKMLFAAERLGVKQLPDLFLFQGPTVNAYTAGVEQPFIAVTTTCLEVLTDEELTAVLAHELGHVHAAHMLYKTAVWAFSLLALVAVNATVGAGALLVKPLQYALHRWDRAAELTADRAMLLVIRRPEVALSTLMKLAGAHPSVVKELSVKAFIAQADRFESMRDENLWSKLIVAWQTMDRSHPFAVERAREMLKFCSEGAFLEILDGDYAQHTMVNTTPCPKCQKAIPAGSVFCPHCAWGIPEDEAEADAADGLDLGKKMDQGFVEARDWFKRTFGGGGDADKPQS